MNFQLIKKDPESAIALFWEAINKGDRVESALKDMAVVMKQIDRAEEAILILQTFRFLCSKHSQHSLDNVLIDLFKVISSLLNSFTISYLSFFSFNLVTILVLVNNHPLNLLFFTFSFLLLHQLGLYVSFIVFQFYYLVFKSDVMFLNQWLQFHFLPLRAMILLI